MFIKQSLNTNYWVILCVCIAALCIISHLIITTLGRNYCDSFFIESETKSSGKLIYLCSPKWQMTKTRSNHIPQFQSYI